MRLKNLAAGLALAGVVYAWTHPGCVRAPRAAHASRTAGSPLDRTTTAPLSPESVEPRVDGSPSTSHRSDVETNEHATEAWLLVLDSSDQRPLAPALVTWRPLDRSRAHALEVGSDTARVDLPPGSGAGVLQIEAPGHVPLRGVFEPAHGPNRILMEPTGALHVDLTGADGAARGGVELALIPPFDDGDVETSLRGGMAPLVTGRPDLQARRLRQTEEGWVQGEAWIELRGRARASIRFDDLLARPSRTTDDQGRASWFGLPARAGYRWSVAPDQHVELQPAHERRRLREVGEVVQVRAAAPRNLSGTFAIGPGEELRLSGRLPPGAPRAHRRRRRRPSCRRRCS